MALVTILAREMRLNFFGVDQALEMLRVPLVTILGLEMRLKWTTLPIFVWVQLRGRNAVAREFLQSSEGDRHGGEKLFFFLLEDRQST